MTTPTTPEPAAAPADKKPHVGARPSRQRPAGATGGHSVQDWEQPVQRPGQPAKLEPLERQAEAPAGEVAESERPSVSRSHPIDDDVDAPMPAVVPRYLRADGRAGGAVREARPQPSQEPAQPQSAVPSPSRPFDARRQTLTAQSAALVDSLTRGLAEALAVSLRPVVASTVDALIPMILSLGSVPDPEPAPVPDAVSWAEETADGEAS